MDKESNKKNYEIALLCPEETGIQEVIKLLAKSGAEILLEGPVEKISLAYPIEKLTSAYFSHLHFSMEPKPLKEMEHDLNTNPSIARYLIVTPPFEKQKPRPMGGRPRGAVRPAQAGEEVAVADKKPAIETLPLSNEALEKKIEEILQQQ